MFCLTYCFPLPITVIKCIYDISISALMQHANSTKRWSIQFTFLLKSALAEKQCRSNSAAFQNKMRLILFKGYFENFEMENASKFKFSFSRYVTK